MSVLETQALDEWIKIYEINKFEPDYKFTWKDKLRIHLKDGFRQQVIFIILKNMHFIYLLIFNILFLFFFTLSICTFQSYSVLWEILTEKKDLQQSLQLFIVH